MQASMGMTLAEEKEKALLSTPNYFFLNEIRGHYVAVEHERTSYVCMP